MGYTLRVKIEELYQTIQALKEHVTNKRYVQLEDFLQLLHIVEIVFIQEVLHMGYGESEAYQKGQELGKFFARAFVVKDDPVAHGRVGTFLAHAFGYKDMDMGLSFIEGFVQGMHDEKLRQLPGQARVHDAQNEL